MDWKEEYEEYWNLILEDLFSCDELDALFNFPVESWEHDVRNWRDVIGSFLSEYIQPSCELLQRFGYITRENDTWVTYEELDEEGWDD